MRKILGRVVDVLIGRESGSSDHEYFGEERAVEWISMPARTIANVGAVFIVGMDSVVTAVKDVCSLDSDMWS